MGTPHFCFPFCYGSVVGLEAVEVRVGKQFEKPSGVIPVIGADFQNNWIAPAEHGWQSVHFEFLERRSLSVRRGLFKAPFQSKPSSQSHSVSLSQDESTIWAA